MKEEKRWGITKYHWEVAEIIVNTLARMGTIAIVLTPTPFWVVAIIWLVMIVYERFIDPLGKEES